MCPLEDYESQAKADILISCEGNEITFSAESEAADRWIRFRYPGKIDHKYSKVRKYVHATFVTPHDEKAALAFKEAAKQQGFVFY